MRRSTSKPLMYPEAVRVLVDELHWGIARVALYYQASEFDVARHLRTGRHNHRQQANKSS